MKFSIFIFSISLIFQKKKEKSPPYSFEILILKKEHFKMLIFFTLVYEKGKKKDMM